MIRSVNVHSHAKLTELLLDDDSLYLLENHDAATVLDCGEA